MVLFENDSVLVFDSLNATSITYGSMKDYISKLRPSKTIHSSIPFSASEYEFLLINCYILSNNGKCHAKIVCVCTKVYTNT